MRLAERLEQLSPATPQTVVAVEDALSAEKRDALVDLDSGVEKSKQLATRQTLRLGEELVIEPSDDLHVLVRNKSLRLEECLLLLVGAGLCPLRVSTQRRSG